MEDCFFQTGNLLFKQPLFKGIPCKTLLNRLKLVKSPFPPTSEAISNQAEMEDGQMEVNG